MNHPSSEDSDVEEVIDELRRTNVDDLFHETAEIQFLERSLDHWSTVTSVSLPPRDAVQASEINGLFLDVARKTQIASYYLGLSDTLYKSVDSSYQRKLKVAIKEVTEGYESRQLKRPGASLIEQMAKSKLEKFVQVIDIAFAMKTFWKQKYDALIEVRKSLEQIQISINMEMKYHPSGVDHD